MNRSLYHFVIFFIVLIALNGLYHGITFIQLEGRIYGLQSYPLWTALMALIELIVLSVLLKYFHHKRYKYAFYAGLVSGVLFLLHYTISYNFLLGKDLGNILRFTYLLYVGGGLAYGISLALSMAGERRWLKRAGIVISVFSLVILTLYIIIVSPANVEIRVTLANVLRWVYLFGTIVPILMILNFQSELKEEKEGDHQQKTKVAPLIFIAMLALCAVGYVVMQIAIESKG